MKGWNEIAVARIIVGCLLTMSGVTFEIVELAQAQTTKSRPKVDANKKWELLHDATDQVLASCDASLTCEVSDQLKQMFRSIMQECVTAK